MHTSRSILHALFIVTACVLLCAVVGFFMGIQVGREFISTNQGQFNSALFGALAGAAVGAFVGLCVGAGLASRHYRTHNPPKK